jgi:hypothetical protein
MKILEFVTTLKLIYNLKINQLNQNEKIIVYSYAFFF